MELSTSDRKFSTVHIRFAGSGLVETCESYVRLCTVCQVQYEIDTDPSRVNSTNLPLRPRKDKPDAEAAESVADSAAPNIPPKPRIATPNTVDVDVFGTAKWLPMGGPKNGKYVAYHGTNSSGAASLAEGGIKSKTLKNPDEFQMAFDPANAAKFGADEAAKMGGSTSIVRYEIPLDLFNDLFNKGHIKQGATTGSLVFDQFAQQAINKAMGL